MGILCLCGLLCKLLREASKQLGGLRECSSRNSIELPRSVLLGHTVVLNQEPMPSVYRYACSISPTTTYGKLTYTLTRERFAMVDLAISYTE